MNAASGMIRTMAASPRVHLCNPKENAAEIAALLSIADELGAQLCVFPELCLTGCSCGDLFYQPALLRAALDALSALALAFGQEALEAETARGQTRCGDRDYCRAGTGERADGNARLSAGVN